MRHLLAVAVALAVACGASPGHAQDGPAPAPAAIDPRSLPVATEIVDLSFPPAKRREMFASILDTMMAQARGASTEVTGGRFTAEVEAILDRHIARARAAIDRVITDASPELFAAIARAYARRFTYDELVQIRAFVATPAGAKFVQSGSELLADPDVARANTAYMSAALAALRPLEAQLMDELRAHYREDGRTPADRPTGTR